VENATMAKSSGPVMLDLAVLSREQVGPFIMLGLDKSADKDDIEKHWADRIRWARKSIIKTPLEDINWAREVLSDAGRRLRADAASLNADLMEGIITKLCVRYGLGPNGAQARLWQPFDTEKPLADYAPPADLPDRETVKAGIAVPDVPQELPAVDGLLERLAQLPLDPWNYELVRSNNVAI
jgi:hypothetical protein